MVRTKSIVIALVCLLGLIATGCNFKHTKRSDDILASDVFDQTIMKSATKVTYYGSNTGIVLEQKEKLTEFLDKLNSFCFKKATDTKEVDGTDTLTSFFITQ